MRRTEEVKFRATVDEIKAVEYLADINNMNVSEYLRSLIQEKLEEEGYRG